MFSSSNISWEKNLNEIYVSNMRFKYSSMQIFKFQICCHICNLTSIQDSSKPGNSKFLKFKRNWLLPSRSIASILSLTFMLNNGLSLSEPWFLDQRSATNWILLDMTIVKNTYLKRDDPYIEEKIVDIYLFRTPNSLIPTDLYPKTLSLIILGSN